LVAFPIPSAFIRVYLRFKKQFLPKGVCLVNSDFSQLSAEERKLRLTALLLGELPPAEADQLRAALAADPELAREHARLQQTIALVRETSAMDRKTAADGTPLRLDDQRREKLLASFKTPAPQAIASPAAAPRRPRDLRFLPLALAAALVGLLVVSVMLPSLAKARARARTSVRFAELSLPKSGAVEKSRASEFDRYAKDTSFISDSARGELEKLVERKGELALTENFSTLTFDTEGTKAALTPKLPAVALAMPVLADTDGDVRALKENVNEFSKSGWMENRPVELLVSRDGSRELARGNGVVSGTTRGFFDDNQNAAPATPGNAPQRWTSYSYDGVGLVGGNSGVVQTPPANLGMMSVENNLAPLAPIAAGGSFFVTSQNVSLPAPANPVPQTVQGANPTWDAPTTSPTPAPEFAGGIGGIGGIGGGGGRGGGRGRTTGAQAGQGSGTLYAGVNVSTSGKSEMSGRSITDLTAVDQKVQGLSYLAPAQAADPLFINGRFGNGDQSGAETFGLQLEAKVKQAEDRLGRADDDVLTPEVLDRMKRTIQNAPSGAGLAGSSPARPGLSPNSSSLATVPSSDSRISVRRSGATLPAQNPASPVSGPTADGGFIFEYVNGDFSGQFVNAGLATNAAANYFISELPATAGDKTFHGGLSRGGVAGNDAWFGANNLGDIGGTGIADGNGTDGLWKFSEGKSTDRAVRLEDRVNVQLPALAGEPQLSRQSSPTRPAGGRQLELALEAGDAVVAKPAPANVTMTGITTLSGGTAAKLEMKEQVAPVEEAKRPAASGMQIVFANNRAMSPFTNAVHAASLGKVMGTNVVTGSAMAKARLLAQDTGSEVARPKLSTNSPTPQPEVLTRDNAFSTFSLNVADVSFKLAAASLEKGAMPDVATVRSEEFINAFDYRDPVPMAGVPLAFVSERARYPFAHNRDALRFSIKTAAQGRDGGRPLNIVLLLDNSGSMERADRVGIIREALHALAAQLQPQDKLSVVAFSRTARLWADGVTGAQAAEIAGKVSALTPEGGTNLEEALDLAYRTALRHYAATAMNRVVLLTDGAANLGNVEPAALKSKVENFRRQGVALDCFGIGWEGFNDDLLEQLSRNGDGRYGFVNSPEEAATEFAGQLAGALQVAASDVKVQVEFNPKRVTAWRQVGYAKHQLTKEQFRDNKVDAAEISASEAGNALYIIETNPRGEGPVATVRARFRVPHTSDYREHEWVVPFGSAVELEQSSSALRLATSASAFSEWLAGSPFAGEVTTDRLLGLMNGVPEVYGADPRPKKLEWMIRQAKSISGK
jgi:Mg-chelatase subunit ChlD